jgi:hypothetical protein
MISLSDCLNDVVGQQQERAPPATANVLNSKIRKK